MRQPVLAGRLAVWRGVLYPTIVVGGDPRMPGGHEARHAIGIEKRRILAGRERTVGRQQRGLTSGIPDAHIPENAPYGGQL